MNSILLSLLLHNRLIDWLIDLIIFFDVKPKISFLCCKKTRADGDKYWWYLERQKSASFFSPTDDDDDDDDDDWSSINHHPTPTTWTARICNQVEEPLHLQYQKLGWIAWPSVAAVCRRHVQIIFNFSSCENVHTISKIVFWSFCLCIYKFSLHQSASANEPYTPTTRLLSVAFH